MLELTGLILRQLNAKCYVLDSLDDFSRCSHTLSLDKACVFDP
jgi:hypothetical protein